MRVLAAVCLALLAATNLFAQEKVESAPHYPLEVGTAWHYKFGEQKFIARVAKHEKLGDTTCAVITANLDGVVLGDEYVGRTKEGLSRFKANGLEVTPPLLFFTLPPKTGSWKVESKLGGITLKGTYQLEEAKVEVPAGKYDTWKLTTDVDASGFAIKGTQYFAEGIGMVKQVIKLGDQPEATFELEKFEKGK